MFETWFPAHWTTLKKLIWIRMTALGNAIKTVTGTIVTFVTSKAAPIVNLTASLSPIQDLHGYDSPWPPGGGKNKFENTATSLTINEVTFTVNSDGTVTCSGTATGTAVFNIVDPNGINQLTDSLILSGCPTGGDIDNTYGLVATTSEGVRLYADSGNGATMVNYATFAKLQIVIRSGTNANGLVFKPMIRLSSVTDATYAPYSNLCPISGHTGVTVHVADGENPHVVDNEYPITFPDSAGTVYGGTLEVNEDGTGQIVLGRSTTVYDGSADEDWTLSAQGGGTYYRAQIYITPDMKNYGVISSAHIIANMAKSSTTDAVGNIKQYSDRIWFYPPSTITTVEAFKTWLGSNNLQICYELAEPVTIPLTAEQVGAVITTLKGQNTMWVDDSDEISVTYYE